MSEIKTVLNFFDKNNGLDGIIKDLKEVKKIQSQINKQKGAIGSDNLKERTAALKEITRLQKQLDKERKKAINTGKQAVGIEKELVKVQEQDRKVKKQLKVARTEKFKQLQETNLALRNQKKLVKADIIENSKLSSVYERQSAKLNRLRKELKNLILTEGEGSIKTKKLAAQVQNLDNKLKKADAAAGQFQRNVGNYPNALKRATGALRNFAGALGITAGITGLVRALGNAINIAKDFEQSNANLAAVLGKTKNEITVLTEDAKRLGAATAFSANQVAGLQTEFAKLGFNEQEILNATEATLSLAAATGSDLSEAAAIAGATLGGFGLGAEETQRVVDVMAKSFSTSALDMEKFKESMKTAAPAAAAVGISVEETTALLGTMANAGISGSRAGNNLAKSFIELNRKGLTLNEAFDKVNSSSNKLKTAVDLVGVNASKAFLVLAKGTKVTKKLTKGLQNAGGAAEKMAKEQLDTLQGSLTILNSAWEGFVLGLLSGDSAFSNMARSIVEGTTAFLGMITATENESDALVKQQIEMNSLVTAITNVNNTEETRKRLIDELNKKYPKFLKNLDNEKVTNEELVLRLREVNKELEKKIIIKRKEEELTKLIEEQVQLRINEIDIIKDLSKAQTDFDKVKGLQIRTDQGVVDAQSRKIGALLREQQALETNRERQSEIATEIEKISLLYDGLVPKIDDASGAFGDGEDPINNNADAINGLTDAEKALVAAMEDELAARKALEQQRELDAIMAAKELENKQEAANFQEDLSKFSKELQQEDFDTFVEFQESGFATFKEFEEAKRRELEETAKLMAELEKQAAEEIAKDKAEKTKAEKEAAKLKKEQQEEAIEQSKE